MKITHENILEEWSKDSEIDKSDISNEFLRVSKLHSKYLRYHILSKDLVEKYKSKYNQLRNVKIEYYNGRLSKEELDHYKWEPFQLKIKLKSEIESYLESDKDLIELIKSKIYFEQLVEATQSIIKELNNRSFLLNGFVTYEKFKSGLN